MLYGILLWVFLAFTGPAWAGDPFGFTGIWTYSETGGDVEDLSQFRHTYILNYSKEMSQYMSLSSSLRYNENLPSEGAATDTTAPWISLDTRNDLFYLNFSASQNQFSRDGAPTNTDSSWGATLFTLDPAWPILRAFFNQGRNYDDSSPRRLDNESLDYGGSVEYTWRDLELLYDLKGSMADNQLDGSTSDNRDQLGQVKFVRDFFSGSLTVNASQQYRENRLITESPTSVGGEFLLPATLLSASSGVDDTPASGSLTDNPSLIDGDLVNSAGVDITTGTVSQNMAAEINFQPVDRLRILLDQELSSALQGLLDWQVWVSDDAISWSQVPNIPAVYRLESARTVVVVDLLSVTSSRYVKVVSDISIVSFAAVFVTELEMGEIRTASASRVSIRTESVSQQSEIGLSYRPNEKWRVSYNFRRFLAEQDRAANTEQLNQSINAGFSPTDRLDFSLGVSDNISKLDGAPDLRTRTYSAFMDAQLLSTFDLSLGYSRSESDGDDGRSLNSDTLNVILNAILYPDLTASLTNGWSRSRDQDDNQATSIWIALDANARMSPELELSLNVSYGESRTEGVIDAPEVSDSTTRYGLTANYRPSDILQFSGTVNRDEERGQNSLSGNSSYLVSRRLQALFSFVYEFGDQESEQYNTTLNWLMTEQFSLEVAGNFVSAAGSDSWVLSSTLNANF